MRSEDTVDQAARDAETIAAALGGDRRAGERLAERLLAVPRLLAAIDASRGHPLAEHDLEDLSQDVLIKVWGKLSQFEGRGTLESWLYRFCLLEYMNRSRRLARGPKLSPCVEPGASPSADASSSPDGEAIESLLQRLGPPDEDLVRLKHFEGLSFTKLGQRLDMSPNTVKTRYYRAIQWLRERMRARVEEAS